MEMTKKELALKLIERLKKAYPEASCTLDYNQADLSTWEKILMMKLVLTVMFAAA